MTHPVPEQPLRYDPSVEDIPDDEADTIDALVDTMRKISQKTYKDYDHAVRSVHAKSHGLLRGELHVREALPEVLAQGLFARPGTYPLVMRLSTNPGDILDDSVSTPRGMAVKAVGVEGERLPGSEGDVTQDFVLVNAPAFLAPDAKAFLKNLKLLAASTDKAEGAKKALSAAMRGVEAGVERLGGESATAKGLGGEPANHILGEAFYSQVPMRYGDYIAKLAVVPDSPELKELRGASINIRDEPDALRNAVVNFFKDQGAQWDVRIQLCTDLQSMPVEDATVVWPEEQSPYITVAHITAPPQDAWSESRVAALDDGLAFGPWHGLDAHRPLGSIMRARKAAYEMSARFRSEHNNQTVVEPRELPR